MGKEARKERNRTLDMIKGLVILAVVVTHLMMSAIVGSESAEQITSFGLGKDILMEIFYSALVLFFMVSGYCYKPRGYVNNVKKRLIQIGGAFVVCTVVLTLIMAGLQAAYGYNVTLDGVFTDIGKVLIGVGAFTDYTEFPFLPAVATYEISHAYYFLEIMLFAFLIFYAIADVSTKNWKTVLATVFILTTMTFLMREFIPFRLPWFLQNVPISAGFMVLGLYAKKRGILEFIDSGYKRMKYWVILAVITVLAVLSAVFFPTRMCFLHSTFGDYGGWSAYTYVITTTLSSYLVAVIASAFAKIPKLSDLLIYIGSHTMTIFLLHMFYAKLIIMQYRVIPIGSMIPSDSLGESVALIIAVIFLCILTSKLISKVKKKFLKNRTSGDGMNPADCESLM